MELISEDDIYLFYICKLTSFTSRNCQGNFPDCDRNQTTKNENETETQTLNRCNDESNKEMLVSRIEPSQLIFVEITESESFGEVTSFPRKPGIYMIFIELLTSIAVFRIETEYLNRVS